MNYVEFGKHIATLGDECLKMQIDEFVEKYGVPREDLENFLQMAKMAGQHETYLELEETLSEKMGS